MKKLLTLGITALSLSLVMPGMIQAEENNITVTTAQFEEVLEYVTDTKTMYSIMNNVNIRKEPNTQSEILGKTLLNTSFEVVAEIDGWSMITTEDGYAYIKSDYLSDTEQNLLYLGKFQISHYCCEKYKHICGTGTGLTASGTIIKPSVISVDPNIIPLGSTLMINGRKYIAEDTGGMIKGKKIDMAVDTHKHALELGIYKTDVYLIK